MKEMYSAPTATKNSKTRDMFNLLDARRSVRADATYKKTMHEPR